MKAPSTALLRAFSPLWRSESSAAASWTARGCLSQQQTANFSSTEARQKRNRKNQGPKPDGRIKAIRYFMSHPLTPRPLRFSRHRALRHWTIHRAWHLFLSKTRRARELELERQYNSMASACEALRHIDDRGMTVEECERVGAEPAQGKELGRLYRTAMHKEGVWDGVPIEYARLQTDSPPREGWNVGWTR